MPHKFNLNQFWRTLSYLNLIDPFLISVPQFRTYVFKFIGINMTQNVPRIDAGCYTIISSFKLIVSEKLLLVSEKYSDIQTVSLNKSLYHVG